MVKSRTPKDVTWKDSHKFKKKELVYYALCAVDANRNYMLELMAGHERSDGLRKKCKKENMDFNAIGYLMVLRLQKGGKKEFTVMSRSKLTEVK